jgi:hypothetical protein
MLSPTEYRLVFTGSSILGAVPYRPHIPSLANLQPYRGIKNALNLFVMVVISSAAFATNKIANHFIFNCSDIVSAIGPFTAGILGNLYSRKMGGTGFTSMVTGVLFLVPVRHDSFCYLS